MSKGVFFDTEFTTMNVNGYPALISIGLVADDGREFYAELADTWETSMCESFVIDQVLPLLAGGESSMPEEQLALKLKEWIEALADDEVVLRSDSPSFDWPWVADFFNLHGWPANLRRKCGKIYFKLHRHQQRYNDGMEEYWKEHSARQHHALVDARSLRFAWAYARRRHCTR